MTGGGKAVVARELTKSFGDFIAVDQLSFEVERGEIFGFLGPNGAGKSTTIRMLCGILPPSSGSANVAGHDVAGERDAVKASIGYMSQKFSLYEDLTVEENITFYGGVYRLGRKRLQERRGWVLDMADLADRGSELARNLPGGLKQRLALGCAILHEPPVLFLDEPTSGVDPINRRMFWDIIYDLSDRGVTVFVTTHYMDEAEYCARLGLIYRGRLIAVGTPAELKSEFMKDTILELRCERPQDVMDDIARLDGVREAALFGRGLHIVVSDAETAGASVTAYIREHAQRCGKGGGTLRAIPASLEDVFVSLMEEHERGGAQVREVSR